MSGSEWIDVNVELPDADLTVLIFSAPDDEPVWLGYFDGDRWCGIHGGELFHQPTHWMLMPEPPPNAGGAA